MLSSASSGIRVEELGHCVLQYNKYLAPCSYYLVITRTIERILTYKLDSWCSFNQRSYRRKIRRTVRIADHRMENDSVQKSAIVVTFFIVLDDLYDSFKL